MYQGLPIENCDVSMAMSNCQCIQYIIKKIGYLEGVYPWILPGDHPKNQQNRQLEWHMNLHFFA